jgi:hypothetical protein
MKAARIYRIPLAVAIIALPLAFSLIWIVKNTNEKAHGDGEIQNNDSSDLKSKRESITFILGEDEKNSRPYYSLAFDYYKTDKSARTEYINDTCRSLSSVRDYLRDNPPGNGLPWGLVNLVSHGNEHIGMSVPVVPDSKRSSTERITEYVNAGKFDPLPDSLMDDSTEIFLHGCGLGKDHELLEIISKAFGGDENRPVVRASKLKEYYSSVRNSDKLLKSQLYYAETWSVYYKFKERPDDEALKEEFTKLYPDETIDWADALLRNSPVNAGDLFHYTINIPLHYTARFKTTDSLPDLSTTEKKEKWISTQKILTNILDKSNIPVNKFKWTTKKTNVTDEKNNKKPAIYVSGWCTVLCVVRPLITEKNIASCDATPFYPVQSDTTYFGVAFAGHPEGM